MISIYLIGINAFHGDSAACLLEDGKVLFAAEEERYRRIKHWAGFPSESIRACLSFGGIKLSDVEHIAINRDSSANFGRKLSYSIVTRPDIGLLIDRWRNRKKWTSIPDEIRTSFPDDEFTGQIHSIEHHLAHMASAYYLSGMDDAVTVSVDGFGDFTSAAWSEGTSGRLNVIGKVFFPHSLGIFYQALTQHLGFPNYGDEYKVMGLASYGRNSRVSDISKMIILNPDGSFKLDLAFFRHYKENIKYEWTDGVPNVGPLFTNALNELIGPARLPGDDISDHHKDIAFATQAVYEGALFHLLNSLKGKTVSTNLALAGGCAMNSVANGKILNMTHFDALSVQAATGDAGGAIGAALEATRKITSNPLPSARSQVLLGEQFSNDYVRGIIDGLEESIESKGCKIIELSDESTLIDHVVDSIMRGGVIGWFQGRMEWGPRALGGRSILGDPRRNDMKDLLNLKIKRRESFRPFAPSVLREEVSEWFSEDDDVPYMSKVLPIKKEKQALIPAVTHVDGTGRLQTVDEKSNGRYYRLIKSFFGRTGVPMILNTSFNENEPIVRHPKEAIDCFLRTQMDMLVIGDIIIERELSAP